DPFGEDYRQAAEVKALADKHAVAIILVHHTRKSQAQGEGQDFVDAISGTLGFAAAADAIRVLERPRGSSEAILQVTGRDVDKQILDALEENPGLSPKRISEETEILPATVRTRLKRLKKAGSVFVEDGKYFRTPSDGETAKQ